MALTMALTLVRMGGRACALPCEYVVEVVPRVKLGGLPDAPHQVLGVINLRGRVVTVFDVRARLSGSPPGALSPYQHLVIVNAGERQLGLAVDEVSDVRNVDPSTIERPNGVLGRGGAGIVRIDQELVLVVSPEDVLHAVG
jgi:purine-binding chemotaxis protein CheW